MECACFRFDEVAKPTAAPAVVSGMRALVPASRNLSLNEAKNFDSFCSRVKLTDGVIRPLLSAATDFFLPLELRFNG